MFLRTEFNYDMNEQSIATGLKCEDISLTVQSEADDADINTIVRRFGVTGQLPVNVRAPTFGDFTGVSDFKSAVDSVRQASESFMEMPAEVRDRFGNDPQKFVEFCSDEKNFEEMDKLGLIREDSPERYRRQAEAKAKEEARVKQALEEHKPVQPAVNTPIP